MEDKPKIIVIIGATSSGKSDLAVELAREFDGEVVSADSRQVYKGLDIGTGKITKREMRSVPHHLLDVASPKKKFTVADFQKKATSTIEKIINKKKIPILAGGTGFYIDSITRGVRYPKVKPNEILREKFSKKTTVECFEYLKKIDPIRARMIDKNNKVRLIRAIEIVHELGRVPKIKTHVPKYGFIKIGLKTSKANLEDRIEKRLQKRIRQGLIKEVQNLHKKGLSWKRMEELGLEYRYVARHLQGKLTKPQMIDQLSTKIKQYARRQDTWMKRDQEVKWFSFGKSLTKSDIEKIKKYVSKNL